MTKMEIDDLTKKHVDLFRKQYEEWETYMDFSHECSDDFLIRLALMEVTRSYEELNKSHKEMLLSVEKDQVTV